MVRAGQEAWYPRYNGCAWMEGQPPPRRPEGVLGKRKGGDPLPSKTGGLQPPEAGDVSIDVPLGPPSAHTWGPREDKDGY